MTSDVPYTSRVAAPTAAPPAPSVPVPEAKGGFAAFMSSLRPVWSKPAAYRALRVTLVMPALFAFTSQVVGNLQMATFAAFGSFATLLFASFGGRAREKALAHTLLAVAGTVLIVIGSAISFNTAVAAVVTVPVAFCVSVFGHCRPERGFRGGSRPGGLRPTRHVARFFQRRPGPTGRMVAGLGVRDHCRTCALAPATRRPTTGRSRQVGRRPGRPAGDALARKCTDADGEAALAAKRALMNAFDAAPFRPTGLAVPDQALANLVESLEWCTTLVTEALREGTDLATVAEVERRMFAGSASVLHDTARLLGGAEVPGLVDNLRDLERTVAEAGDAIIDDQGPNEEEAVHVSFHARLVAAASISCAADALIATRQADPDIVAAELSRWQGDPEGSSALPGGRSSSTPPVVS